MKKVSIIILWLFWFILGAVSLTLVFVDAPGSKILLVNAIGLAGCILWVIIAVLLYGNIDFSRHKKQ